ncbi:hypothetical protein [Actinomadura hibisca]|uniref:hypothetical protein n=1 Tax=Actinomadura hibisca TaxID=68565 RepID=UPI00082C8F8C|nr:hypothetical protein [Actinomadura hibisca]
MTAAPPASAAARLLLAAAAGAALAALSGSTPAAARPGTLTLLATVQSAHALRPADHSRSANAPITQSVAGNYAAPHWKATGAGTTRVRETTGLPSPDPAR